MRGSPFYLAISELGRCLRCEYAPSRKRYKPSALDSDAAMVQRKGGSFPCFMPYGSSQGEAIRLALSINPIDKLLASALSPADQACVKYNCLGSNLPKRRRRWVIKHMDKLSERLQQLQRKLSGGIPESAPARKLNIPLIFARTTRINYTDKAFTSDLVRRMPIVGGIPRPNALPAQETLATMSLHDVKGPIETTNLKILKSLWGSADEILIQNDGIFLGRSLRRDGSPPQPSCMALIYSAQSSRRCFSFLNTTGFKSPNFG